MSFRYVFSSMTRISDLPRAAFSVEPLAKKHWEVGDYVIARVERTGGDDTIELASGRVVHVTEGDQVVGAFGKRFATLDATGDWEQVGADGRMHALTEGGLFGKCLSQSSWVPPLMPITYGGHVLVRGKKARMQDYLPLAPERAFDLPVVLIIGSSMSAGKTRSAQTIIRLLKASGRRVLGAKLTGSGRYHDVLTMEDAGADAIFDFVDAGLPSTVCPTDVYRKAVRQLLSRMASTDVDVAVIEVGASPLEPYNGAVAVEELRSNVRMTVLCASDPYAVVGVMTAFDCRPDLVTGIVSNTDASLALVEKLAGVRALNISVHANLPEVSRLIEEKLPLPYDLALSHRN